MRQRRLLLGIAVSLAAMGGSALAAGVGPAPTTVSLSDGGGATPTTQLPDLNFGEGSGHEATTTTAPTTTTPAPTTTPTTAGPTPTSAQPVSTTTTTVPVGNDEAVIYVENTTAYEVRVAISDETSNEWVLAPGQKAGPWTLKTSNEHGDGGSVKRTDIPCGAADGHDYFAGGHTYRLEVVDSTYACTDTDQRTAPRLLVRDLTTGTSDYLE